MITLFLHIPRTGGTTLTELLAERETVWRVSEGMLAILMRVQGCKVSGFDVMVGHVPYGVHRLLWKDDDYQYATMLRDPVDRVASIYYFYRGRDEWSKPNLKWKRMAEEMDLGEFCQGAYAELENAQTRQIVGAKITGQYGHLITDRDLDEAIDRLREEFAWVGLTERFDESVERLAGVMGWDDVPEYGHSNPSDREPVDEETANLIREINWADCVLYEYAEGLCG